MTATLPLHALFLYLLLGEPVLGWLAYGRFQRRVRQNPVVRARYYLVTIATEWLLVAFFFWGARRAGISRAALGIGPIRPEALPGAGMSGSLWLAVVVGLLVGIAAPVVLVRVNPGYRQKARSGLERLRPLLPATGGQVALFAWLALTAGICEELLYRSFLFWYFRQLGFLGQLGLVLLASGLVFALGHAYQGIRGLLAAGMLGCALGVFYALTGSVLVPAVLHAAIDLRVLGLLRALRAEPAAAT